MLETWHVVVGIAGGVVALMAAAWRLSSWVVRSQTARLQGRQHSHEQICAERYANIDRRLAAIETRSKSSEDKLDALIMTLMRDGGRAQ